MVLVWPFFSSACQSMPAKNGWCLILEGRLALILFSGHTYTFTAAHLVSWLIQRKQQSDDGDQHNMLLPHLQQSNKEKFGSIG